MDIDLILKDLNILKVEGKTGKSLSTFKIGGNLKNLIYIDSKDKLACLLKEFHKNNISCTTLGNGSNVLFKDEDIDDVFIKLASDFKEIKKISNDTFFIGASKLMPSLSSTFQNEGLSGFEFGCNLPSELGGTLFMNASFRGQKISDVLESLELCLENGEIVTIKKDKLEIVPKRIKIPHNSIITGGVFKFTPLSKEVIKAKIDENMEFRQRTQPKGASCGCVFKNPSADMPAGMLLDKVGMKGTRVGGASYSTLHANWIINDSLKATSYDVKKLIEIGKEKVFKEYSIELETELVIL